MNTDSSLIFLVPLVGLGMCLIIFLVTLLFSSTNGLDRAQYAAVTACSIPGCGNNATYRWNGWEGRGDKVRRTAVCRDHGTRVGWRVLEDAGPPTAHSLVADYPGKVKQRERVSSRCGKLSYPLWGLREAKATDRHCATCRLVEESTQ